jgi:hypothetical protein
MKQQRDGIPKPAADGTPVTAIIVISLPEHGIRVGGLIEALHCKARTACNCFMLIELRNGGLTSRKSRSKEMQPRSKNM